MGKNALLVAGLFYAALPFSQAGASDGEVVAATGLECSNYFVVKVGEEYVLLEWYGGYMPDKGDKVTGEFSSFGFENISVQPSGAQLRVWVEDYDLSLDSANDKLKEKCN